jgi:ATP-dependent helicase YprA (DUF1998 family)
MTGPIDVFEELRDDMFRYYETPYRLRDDAISRERRRLLDADGVAYREPWLEPIADYVHAQFPLTKSLHSVGAHPELSAFLTSGLFDSSFDRLYLHQQRAVDAAVRRKNVVVTAGTGGGKTEAFLVPLLNALVTESSTWTGKRADFDPWWNDRDRIWVPQRQTERGRTSAVRALLLYPMNALVEDQVSRLRRALDAPEVHTWLDDHRKGHRFTFGRYTGKTPVSGRQPARPSDRSVRRLSSTLRRQEALYQRVANDPNIRSFVGRVDGGEMISRWDMQDYPPDLLITNYSMLNIALMRSLEQPCSSKQSVGSKKTHPTRFESSSTNCTCTGAPPAPKSPTCCERF